MDSKPLKPEVEAAYGHRIRTRVGALLLSPDVDDAKILLVEHEGLSDDRPFWTPPGGEVQFGESLSEAVRRETREETGLDVAAEALVYVLDFVRPPLHAVSFYFRCRVEAGTLQAGLDPELPTQLIRRVAWVPLKALSGISFLPIAVGARIAADIGKGLDFPPVYLGTSR